MYKKRLFKWLFSEPVSSSTKSMLILFARIILGFLFLSHGIAKIHFYSEAPYTFPNPIGIGSTLSLWLVLFAEILCSLGFIIGALFRLCLIPMIFTMLVAVLVVHSGDPFATKDLALMYLAIFVLMFISGPGIFSVDAVLKGFFK